MTKKMKKKKKLQNFKAYLNKYILYIQKWLCFEKLMTTMTKKKIFEDDEYFE